MHGHVESTTRVNRAIVRVVLGGEGLAEFAMPAATGAYVNLALPPAGAPYDHLFEPAEVRAEHAKEWWPARRRSTVRSWDDAHGLLTIDFVVHGDEGVAGPGAASARHGDVLILEGRSGGYLPDPEADWHLMVGDESARPSTSSRWRPPATSTCAGCTGPASPIRAGCSSPRSGSSRSLRGGSTPSSTAGPTRSGRYARHLVAERGIDRSAMSCSPYWRRTMTDEDWRRVKSELVAAMDSDVA